MPVARPISIHVAIGPEAQPQDPNNYMPGCLMCVYMEMLYSLKLRLYFRRHKNKLVCSKIGGFSKKTVVLLTLVSKTKATQTRSGLFQFLYFLILLLSTASKRTHHIIHLTLCTWHLHHAHHWILWTLRCAKFAQIIRKANHEVAL